MLRPETATVGSIRSFMHERSIWDMNVQKARSPSASPPWPPPAAARPGLMGDGPKIVRAGTLATRHARAPGLPTRALVPPR